MIVWSAPMPCWPLLDGCRLTYWRCRQQIYDPQVHYQQVRDAWIGVRTPTAMRCSDRMLIAREMRHSFCPARPYQIVENGPFPGGKDEVGWHSGNDVVA